MFMDCAGFVFFTVLVPVPLFAPSCFLSFSVIISLFSSICVSVIILCI